jgi:hypothetical protein
MLAAMRVAIFVVCLLGCGSTKPSPNTPSTDAVKLTAAVPPAHRLPKRTADVRVRVTGNAITFNGVPISGQPRVADIKAIYGEPDRTWDSGGANRIHTWDTLGILVYEPYATDGKSGDGRCISATFPFKAMSPSFSPKALFGGVVVLDNKVLAPTLSLGGVMKWPGATQPYTKQSIVFDREEFHVFALEETAGQGLDLVELSFWQKRTTPIRPAPRTPDRFDEDDCKTGDVPHCTSRALAYQSGTAGRRNLERAFELVRISCAGGDVFGCVMIGNMYDAGKGTPQNKSEARSAWQRACTLGYKPACSR